LLLLLGGNIVYAKKQLQYLDMGEKGGVKIGGKTEKGRVNRGQKRGGAM